MSRRTLRSVTPSWLANSPPAQKRWDCNSDNTLSSRAEVWTMRGLLESRTESVRESSYLLLVTGASPKAPPPLQEFRHDDLFRRILLSLHGCPDVQRQLPVRRCAFRGRLRLERWDDPVQLHHLHQDGLVVRGREAGG